MKAWQATRARELATASGSKAFFFEKKAAKNFWSFWLRRGRGRPAQRVKSFLVLFFKKAPLSSACLRFADILRPTWAVTFFQ
jgi:hypothetical protein